MCDFNQKVFRLIKENNGNEKLGFILYENQDIVMGRII